MVEPLGDELRLHFSAADRAFVACVSTDTKTAPGATMRAGLDPRKDHLVDRATEEAIG